MTTAALPHAPAHPTPAAARRPQAVGRAWGGREWLLLRWGIRAALVLGVAASVVANILHAQPNPISQAIAAWPPLALLFTVELIARVPVHRRELAAARLLAATAIAGIAAYVSYWHMVGVAARYGETGASPYLLPLSVDGLIIVASISLVEISGRLHTLTTEPTTASEMPAPTPRLPDGGDAGPATSAPPAVAQPTSSPGPLVPPATEPATTGQHDVAPQQPQPADPEQTAPPAAPPGPSPNPGEQSEDLAEPNTEAPQEHDQVPTTPREAIAYWRQRQPDLGIDELAARIGKSVRQTRRYLDSPTPGTDTPRKVNGQRNDRVAATLRSGTS